eukprot:SAG22_NODE_1169_length_5270_cov_15.228969_3_plen_371_part_00
MRAVSRCVSSRLEKFDDCADGAMVMKSDADDDPCVDVYTNSAVHYEGHYLLIPSFFRHFPAPPAWCCTNDGVWDSRIVASRDGLNFSYIGGDREPFLYRGTASGPAPDTTAAQQPVCSEIGNSSSWDASMISIVRGYVESGEVLRLYYWGDVVRHGHHTVPCPTTGFGMLELRKHGFASISSAAAWSAAPGQLLTKPLLTGGRIQLALNVRTANAASIRAELCDAWTGEALPGYELNRSVPVSGNYIDRSMEWQLANGTSASLTPNRSVRLRLVMRGHVDVFSFRFKTTDDAAVAKQQYGAACHHQYGAAWHLPPSVDRTRWWLRGDAIRTRSRGALVHVMRTVTDSTCGPWRCGEQDCSRSGQPPKPFL